jgi:hypothetical protein
MFFWHNRGRLLVVGLCLELSLELSSYWALAFSSPTPWKPAFRSDTTLSRER